MGGPPAAPSSDRIVACMDPAAVGTPVLQAAARLAAELRTPWYAVYVTRPTARNGDSNASLADNIRTAERLGGTVVHVTADRAASGVCAFAEREGATHVVFGEHRNHARWSRGSTAEELRRTIRGATLIAVEIEHR